MKKNIESKTQEKKKGKGGRPSSYKEGFAVQAFNYCLLGATDEDLAQFFEVQKSTINNWKKDHPEFLDSIKKGKVQADAVIASSLYNRAKGAIINQQQAFKVKSVTYNDKGQRTEIESIEIVDLQQEQPPDTTAAIFWLKNRNPENWRDKTSTEVTGKDGKDLISSIQIIDKTGLFK